MGILAEEAALPFLAHMKESSGRAIIVVKQDIAVTILVRLICVLCVCPLRFVRAITLTFMHGFQNYLTQVVSLRRRSAI